MAINPDKSDTYPLSTPKDLTKEIEAYMSLKLYKTRNGAIRALIRRGLKAEYEESPQLKHDMQKLINEPKED